MNNDPVENYQSFFARLEGKMPEEDFLDIEQGYIVAKFAHRHDKRKQIDPATNQPIRYFEHPRHAAIILIDLVGCYVPSLIIAMLLHDTIEDTTAVNPRKIKRWFGREIHDLVLLMSKTPENKDRYLTHIWEAGDWRVWLLKGCDRLHNLRTLGAGSPEFIKRQIAETRVHYYPLMERLAATCPQVFTAGAVRLRDAISAMCDQYDKR